MERSAAYIEGYREGVIAVRKEARAILELPELASHQQLAASFIRDGVSVETAKTLVAQLGLKAGAEVGNVTSLSASDQALVDRILKIGGDIQ